VKTVVLCSSANFYKHTIEVTGELEKLGFTAVLPLSAREMRESGNFNAQSNRTWFDNPDDFVRKTNYIRQHFDEVAKGDAVLVVNDEKHGVPGYIGANVLLEMGLAFYLNKPIYVLSPVSKEVSNYEEVIGMGSVIIDNDLTKIGK
jgi:diphthamide synthase subunit DPH2